MVRAADLDRVVLLVTGPMDKLQGEIPVGMAIPELRSYGHVSVQNRRRSRCPNDRLCRPRPWYDLTSLVRPGIAFWPMAQQYRHIIAANPEGLICNHNLFAIAPAGLSQGVNRPGGSFELDLGRSVQDVLRAFRRHRGQSEDRSGGREPLGGARPRGVPAALHNDSPRRWRG